MESLFCGGGMAARGEGGLIRKVHEVITGRRGWFRGGGFGGVGFGRVDFCPRGEILLWPY